ncbi:MAG TPA: Glu-tRNA(Gln) amidotransferase GatDE subunit D, partial [Candidatus Altiarchaeales archaeon]|nr:Glu-tRNA(Gln) amidotransferase GatDE subunit D [Candidatus Altiarchaeales archaeon]
MQNLSKEIGKKVRIETIDNEIISGMLMPRVELLSEDYVTIKLDNGYNIGVKKSRIKSISIIEDLRKDKLSVELKKPKRKSERKNISILATGGTIASRVDYVTGGVKAAITPEELILSVPEIEDLANISSREIFNKFSENLKPEDWITIAKEIYKEIKKEKPYGVVVTHGTDTMAYTSAALAFMLKTPVPIVLT